MKKRRLNEQLKKHYEYLTFIQNIPNEDFLIFNKRDKQHKHLPFLFKNEAFKISLDYHHYRSIFIESEPVELINNLKLSAQRKYNLIKMIRSFYDYDPDIWYFKDVLGYDLIEDLIVKIDVKSKNDYIKYNIQSLYRESKPMYIDIYIIPNENFHLSYELKKNQFNNIFILAKNHKNKWSILGDFCNEFKTINNYDFDLNKFDVVKSTLENISKNIK